MFQLMTDTLQNARQMSKIYQVEIVHTQVHVGNGRLRRSIYRTADASTLRAHSSEQILHPPVPERIFVAIMRSSSSFGSGENTRAMTSTNNQAEETQESDWGIVSHSGSEMEAYGSSSSGDFGHGILILDGLDTESGHLGPSSELSIPKTDSLPSEIGSLSEDRGSFHEEHFQMESSMRQSRRITFFLAFGFLSTLSVATGIFFHQRNSYVSSVKELQKKIEILEKEKEEIIAASEIPPPWIEEEDPNGSFLTLLDNCWIKAKMKVKLGDCATGGGGLRNAIFGGVTGAMGRWLDDVSPNCKSDGNEGQKCRGVHQVVETFKGLPHVVTDTFATANKAFVAKIAEVKTAVDEVQDEFVRASEELVRASGEVFAGGEF